MEITYSPSPPTGISSYQDVGELEIIAPVRSYLTLATDVPHVQFHPVRLHGLDVEPLRGRYVRHVFGRQFLHQRRLARVVQPQQQDTKLFVRRRTQPFQHRQQSLHVTRIDIIQYYRIINC